MNDNLKKAAELLRNGNYTFAASDGENVIISSERGVKPLLELLDGRENLHGFSAADKVIGKAAAFLYVLLKPDEIYTGVISKPALEVLKKYGVKIQYDLLTEAIRNRVNTGFCPMETAVKNTEDPGDALVLIRETLFKILNKTEKN